MGPNLVWLLHLRAFDRHPLEEAVNRHDALALAASWNTPNKRTALYENLVPFSPQQQYRIIKELCEHRSFAPLQNSKRNDLKVRLVTRYGHLAEDGASEINETLIQDTCHWLDGFPEALNLYNDALKKYEHGSSSTNPLDDLRLALERLLRTVLDNENL